MLYDMDTYQNIVLTLYDYLQRSVKKMPRSIKWEKPSHRKTVISFIESLPDTAGVQFIWDFLVFQFYIYNFQDQKLRPLPVWFMGKEAWERWKSYDSGARYHALEWAKEHHIENPLRNVNYKNVAQSVLEAERLRMSRISGPNYCGLKYDNPYDGSSRMCMSCPFVWDCDTLYGGK